MIDVTDLFLEKVAQPPDPESKEEDDGKIDPGEAALIGVAAASGGLLGRGTEYVGNRVLRAFAEARDVQVPLTPPVRGISRPSEYGAAHAKALRDMKAGKKIPMFGGLFGYSPIPIDVGGKSFTRAQLQQAEVLKKRISRTNHMVESFMDKYDLGKRGVKLDFVAGGLSGNYGPRYMKATKMVSFPAYSTTAALHELGHAADYTAPLGLGKGRSLGKIRRYLEPALLRGSAIALPVALIAGDEIAKAIPGSVDDRVIKFVQDNAPGIMAGTLAATTLYPEAKASLLAVKHVRATEGAAAARNALKALGPAFGTYVMGAIPAIVGMALARKFMNEARKSNAELDAEKTAGPVRFVTDVIKRDVAQMLTGGVTIANLVPQVAAGTARFIASPNRIKRMAQVARNVGTSPEFVQGALTSAVPAAMGAMYLYSTTSGKVARRKLAPEALAEIQGIKPKAEINKTEEDETWREQNPALYAGVVGLGAALAGGILSKFIGDVARVI